MSTISDKILSTIHEILLPEAMEVDNYLAQFRKVGIPDKYIHAKVTQAVEEMIRVLKKNNRVQWLVRWYLLGEFGNFVQRLQPGVNSVTNYFSKGLIDVGLANESESDEDIHKRYVEKYRDLCDKYAKASGKSFDEVEASRIDSAMQFRHIMGQFEHYFASGTLAVVPKIARYNFQWQSASQVIAEFNQMEQEARFKDSDLGDVDPKKLIKPDNFEKGAERITEFPDGYVWWNLNTNYSKEEANSNSNCGKCEKDDSTLLSLRRPFKVGGKIWWKSDITVELTAIGRMRQCRNFNDKPPEKFHPHIVALLSDGDIIKGLEKPSWNPDNTFYMEDLSDEERKALMEKNPDLGSVNSIDLVYGILEENNFVPNIKFINHFRTTLGEEVQWWDEDGDLTLQMAEDDVECPSFYSEGSLLKDSHVKIGSLLDIMQVVPQGIYGHATRGEFRSAIYQDWKMDKNITKEVFLKCWEMDKRKVVGYIKEHDSDSDFDEIDFDNPEEVFKVLYMGAGTPNIMPSKLLDVCWDDAQESIASVLLEKYNEKFRHDFEYEISDNIGKGFGMVVKMSKKSDPDDSIRGIWVDVYADARRMVEYFIDLVEAESFVEAFGFDHKSFSFDMDWYDYSSSDLDIDHIAGRIIRRRLQ